MCFMKKLWCHLWKHEICGSSCLFQVETDTTLKISLVNNEQVLSNFQIIHRHRDRDVYSQCKLSHDESPILIFGQSPPMFISHLFVMTFLFQFSSDQLHASVHLYHFTSVPVTFSFDFGINPSFFPLKLDVILFSQLFSSPNKIVSDRNKRGCHVDCLGLFYLFFFTASIVSRSMFLMVIVLSNSFHLRHFSSSCLSLSHPSSLCLKQLVLFLVQWLWV